MDDPPKRELRLRIPLRWRDMDTLGHLNQAVYHELLEEGRIAFLDRGQSKEHGLPYVVVRVELDYRHEVRRTDNEVEVVVRVAMLGRRSITLDHEILLPGGRVAAAGRTVLSAWDPATRGSRELTEQERSDFS
jgi:acyl-CoA thioester hydrolase